jgi:hypothetical protein
MRKMGVDLNYSLRCLVIASSVSFASRVVMECVCDGQWEQSRILEVIGKHTTPELRHITQCMRLSPLFFHLVAAVVERDRGSPIR